MSNFDFEKSNEMDLFQRVADATGSTLEVVCSMRKEERAGLIAALEQKNPEETPRMRTPRTPKPGTPVSQKTPPQVGSADSHW
jgi:hypothetical protein